MFDTYPDIEYDEQTRRINRRMKLAVVPLLVLLVGLSAYGISQVDLRKGPIVVNDTRGNIVCVHVTRRTSSDSDYDHSLDGFLKAGDEDRINSSSACTVFTAAGDYQGCIFLPAGISKDQRILASEAQTRVKAEACVYPR